MHVLFLVSWMKELILSLSHSAVSVAAFGINLVIFCSFLAHDTISKHHWHWSLIHVCGAWAPAVSWRPRAATPGCCWCAENVLFCPKSFTDVLPMRQLSKRFDSFFKLSTALCSHVLPVSERFSVRLLRQTNMLVNQSFTCSASKKRTGSVIVWLFCDKAGRRWIAATSSDESTVGRILLALAKLAISRHRIDHTHTRQQHQCFHIL